MAAEKLLAVPKEAVLGSGQAFSTSSCSGLKYHGLGSDLDEVKLCMNDS